MAAVDEAQSLDAQIGQWRRYLQRRQAIHTVDVAELEDHLREQIATLAEAGLATDEAFLVAVKRMGSLDALSREFAREHSDRLWKQLVVAPTDPAQGRTGARTDAMVAFFVAAAAALALKAPAIFGRPMTENNTGFYMVNLSLFVLPFLAGYFVWKRSVEQVTVRWLVAGFAAAVAFANGYPFVSGGDTQALTALHLPIALWLSVGVAYAADRWSAVAGRMDFVRFSGELFIYFVLIALGGGVLAAFIAMMFAAIAIDVEPFLEAWLPSAALGGIVIAAWLVEAKQSVIENMAPVLTRLFTPLFAAMLITFLAVLAFTGRGIDIERDVLIAFDLLLVIVLGLLLYSVSARDPHAPPDAFDVLQVLLVACALMADAVALWAIAVRIQEFGFSANRVAALGENVILLVNLSWSAVLYIRFLNGRASFAALERWQMDYLPVYAAWAALVVIVFPPLFAFS